MNDLEEIVMATSAGLLALLGLSAIVYSVLLPILFLFDAMPQSPWLIYVGYCLSFFSLFFWFIIANLVVRIVWYGAIFSVVVAISVVVYACKILFRVG